VNLLAHVLAALLATRLVVPGTPDPTPWAVLHTPAYVSALIASVLPDLDHVPHLLRALRSGRFGPGSRSPLHELPGLAIYSATALVLCHWGLGAPFMAGIATHYLLDYGTRPVRPAHPLSERVVFYGLAPRRDLRALVYYDVGFTGFLLTALLYFLHPLSLLLAIPSAAFLLASLRGVDEGEVESGTGGVRYASLPSRAKELVLRYVRPVVRVLAPLGPSRISGLSMFLTLPVPFLVSQGHWYAAAAVLICVLILDSLDGAVARYLGISGGLTGWLTDVSADRVSEALMCVALPWPFTLLLTINVVLTLLSLRWGRNVILPLRHLAVIYLIL